MKNRKRAYLECVVRCGRGFRCRYAESRANPRLCALLCAGAEPDRAARHRRIWADILGKGQGHEHR